ncbi:MAG TPA: hypothetical protein VMF89_19525 [Polyangiales bacterium]|nr:hypothetical protein [Polyangiales bacterium]
MSGARTFKFLAAGARGPVSGFQWPAPGTWVETSSVIEPCVRGAHLCRVIDLPYWLHDELWELEHAGEQVEGIDCLVVQRARLVRRFAGWQADGARQFLAACAQHAAETAAQAAPEARARAQGYVDDAEECVAAHVIAFGAFSAAVAVGKLAAEADAVRAYRNERAWQADWLFRCVIGGN